MFVYRNTLLSIIYAKQYMHSKDKSVATNVSLIICTIPPGFITSKIVFEEKELASR